MTRDALVVGINNYANDFDNLKTPAGDAEAIAQLLEQYGEFNVVKRLPECIRDDKLQVDSDGTVTVAQLQQALEQLFDPKGDNIPGTALFFFAGHGHRVKKQDGQYEGFLATSESHPDPAKGKPGLSLQWLRELLQRSPVREQVVWLDCCHSGELLNFEEVNPAFWKGRNRCLIAASRGHEAASQEPGGKHGLFTSALLKGLDPSRLNKGDVNGSDLKSFIDGQRGWPQQPVCLVFGQSIELTRGQNYNPPPSKKYWLKVVGGIIGVAVAFLMVKCLLFENLKRNAEGGDLNAQTRLGLAYYQGQDCAMQNYDTAFYWFNKAATKRYAEAQCHLSSMYAKGQSVSKDEKKALDLLKESAENDYPLAQYRLGMTYRDGLLGMPKNQGLALKWIGKAAAHAFGGKTVPYISSEDTQWLRKAAAEGNADAQFILGVLNETGTGGVQKNLSVVSKSCCTRAPGSGGGNREVRKVVYSSLTFVMAKSPYALFSRNRRLPHCDRIGISQI